jgi:hypothetical protein
MRPNGLPRQAGAVIALFRDPIQITLARIVAKNGGIDKSHAGQRRGPLPCRHGCGG